MCVTKEQVLRGCRVGGREKGGGGGGEWWTVGTDGIGIIGTAG